MIDKISLIDKRRAILIGTGVLLIAAVILFIFSLLQLTTDPSRREDTPIPTSYPLSQIRQKETFNQQNSLPGVTQESEVARKPNIINQNELGNGMTEYNINSINPFRPTEIVTKDGIVIFERTIVPSDPNAQERLNLNMVKGKLGEPDQIITGSSSYGPFNNTYSYSSKGFVFIANPQSHDVYEIHSFIPMSTKQYLESFGETIISEHEEKL